MANYKQRRTEEIRKWRADKWNVVPPPDPEQIFDRDPTEVFIEWSETCLIIPSGPLVGQPFKIPNWQADFVQDLFDEDIQEAGLCVARKNGKSGLIAALFLCHLAGPLNRHDWRGLVTSITGRVAVELREAIVSTGNASDIVGYRRYKSPLPGRIEGARESRIDFLAADKATGHAFGADIALIDEAGLLDEKKRPLWNAVFSCISGRNGKFGAISIKGDGPMFEEMSQRKDEAEVGFHNYVADLEDPIDDEATWHKGNPGIADGIKSLKYMQAASKRAMQSPANQPDFMAFDLNMPLSPNREMICTVNQWKECETPYYDLPEAKGLCILGIDLGGSASMTCAVAFWPETGRAESWGAFPNNPNLLERGIADGVNRRYVNMEDEGDIRTYPGRVTPVKEFLEDLIDELAQRRIYPHIIGADRYRKAEAMEVFDELTFNFEVEWRGQGASAIADGSHDVRAWQKYVLDKYIQHKPALLVTSAIAESEIDRDAKGNPALRRARTRGRIDVLQAFVIAAGIGKLRKAKKRTRRSTVVA